MFQDNSPADRARFAMQEARYCEAIVLFEAQLARDPNDLRSLLQLGFCHLLNRSEQRFVSIYQEATALKRRLGEVSEAVGRLFHRYEAWVKKLTATALVLSSVAAGACHDDATYAVPLYAAPGYESTDSDSDTDADAGDTDTSEASYQATLSE